jgi:hypothetical protein
MKKSTAFFSVMLITNVFATDIYNSNNGQLTIPSVNVSGINYNNVVITVAVVGKIGGTGGFAIQNVNKILFSKPRTIVINSKDNANPANQYVMTLNYAPDTDVTFENQAVNVIKQTVNTTINGKLAGTYEQKNYFVKGDLSTQIGQSDDQNYSIFSNANKPTKNLNIGEFGFLYASVVYSDSTKKIIKHYTVYDYSLEQSSDGASAYACKIENQFAPSNISSAPVITKFCFQIDNYGNLLGGVNAILNVNNAISNFTGTVQ